MALIKEAASSNGTTRAPEARAVACTRGLGPSPRLVSSDITPGNGPKLQKLLFDCLMGSAGRYEIGTASIGAANTLYCPSVAQRNEHILENSLTEVPIY
jgi:hypothetical protein